jgi:TrmH family RNA methyltransferase
MIKITSVHNKKILKLRKLYKSRERKAADVFLVEGVKEVSRGIASGFEPDSIYFCSDIYKEDIQEILPDNIDIPVYDLEKAVYEKIAYRDNTEGIIALFRKKIFSLNDFKPKSDDELFVVLESVEKPGNLGAVLRTADAVRATAIILTESKVDQYHPNVIRASLGAVFTVPVIVTSNQGTLEWLKKNNIKFYAAALPAYKNIFELDLKKNIALVFGTESEGLSDFWLENSSENYTIPMRGIVDSLNVSVSVAVSVYEAERQRRAD